MRNFTFSDKTFELEIEGHAFKVDASSADKMQRVHKTANEIINKSDELAASENIEESIIALCSFINEVVNDILGDGSYEKIFAGRTVDLLDHIELMQFVVGELNAFRESKMKSYSPDRLQK